MNVHDRIKKLELMESSIDVLRTQAAELGIDDSGVNGLRSHVARDLDTAYAQRAREDRKNAPRAVEPEKRK